MYTSAQDFTLSCAEGETGATVVRSATATSIISSRDAYLKAYGLAKALAVEFLECTSDPGPAATIYYNVEKSVTVNNDSGYVTDSWTVTVEAGTIYSLVSQAAADAAAETAATVQATQQKNLLQRPQYTNRAQSAVGACSADYDPYSITVTISASAVTSDNSQADADSKALSQAVSTVTAALTSNCVRIYQSIPVAGSAVCSGGTVGETVIVNYPAGWVTESSSQSAVNSKALSQATSAASAALTCSSGYYNSSQVASAACSTVYPSPPGCWVGGGDQGTVAAGEFYAATSSAANSLALSAAKSKAISNLHCFNICP